MTILNSVIFNVGQDLTNQPLADGELANGAPFNGDFANLIRQLQSIKGEDQKGSEETSQDFVDMDGTEADKTALHAALPGLDLATLEGEAGKLALARLVSFLDTTEQQSKFVDTPIVDEAMIASELEAVSLDVPLSLEDIAHIKAFLQALQDEVSAPVSSDVDATLVVSDDELGICS